MVKNSGKTVNGASYIPILVDGNMYQDATVRALEYFFGAMQIDDEGNYQDWIQAPESKHALEFLNNCVRKGYIDPNHRGWNGQNRYDLDFNGRHPFIRGNPSCPAA